MTDLDPAVSAWYDFEAEMIESAISMIRVYQFKMPDGIGPYHHWQAPWPRDWWEAFWERLESDAFVEQRTLFIRRWREKNLPGGRQSELSRYLESDPRWDRYKPHGQQHLVDYEEGEPA